MQVQIFGQVLLHFVQKVRLRIDLLAHVLHYLLLFIELLQQVGIFLLQDQVVRVKLLDHLAHELETIGERLHLL